jgi:hypothetical protein
MLPLLRSTLAARFGGGAVGVRDGGPDETRAVRAGVVPDRGRDAPAFRDSAREVWRLGARLLLLAVAP